MDLNSELIQSQDLLNQHVIVSTTDSRGYITYVNDKFCDISGYSRSELLGKKHNLLKSDIHSPEFYNDLWKTIASGQTWSGEICNRKKSGEHYWVKATIAPFTDGSGIPYKYVSYRTDITDVKRQDEAHLALLNSTKECIHGLDQDGYCEFINPAACNALGFEEHELLGQRLHNIIHHHKEDGSEHSNVDCAVFKTLKDKQTRQCTDWFIRKDGTGFPIELIIAPRFENNQFVGALLSYHDITERRETETKLKESEQRLKIALNGANSGVWEWNIKTGELFWSERIAPLFGYAEGEIEVSYQNFIKHIHPDDLAAVEKAIQESIIDGKPYEIEHRIINPQGQVHWLLEKGSVFYDKHGNAEKMFGTVMSIHQRKLVELDLKQTQERFSIAIDGAGDGVWDWDLNSGEVVVSDIYAEMLGYTKQELSPFTLKHWQEMLHPEDKLSSLNLVKAYLKGETKSYENKFRMKCKDGSWKWILARGKSLSHNTAGNPTRMMGIHTDISTQKQLEIELQAAKEYAEQANLAKSEFLSSMSHELRTPLNAILGFSQLLMLDDDVPLTESQRISVDHILNAGKHLVTLINEVLQLSAIEAGKTAINIERIALKKVVEEVRSLLFPLTESRNISIEATILNEAYVMADEIKLKQILLNLVSNAIKYNRDNGSVIINVSESNNHRLKISISDTGIGIAESVQAKVFSAFDRLGQETSTIEGTGIGLVVTKTLVELMDGIIGFSSQQGKGTTFWVELPVPKKSGLGSAIELNELPNQDSKLLNPISSAKRNILYVEDNVENRKLMESYFKMFPSIHLHAVETADLALKNLSDNSYDLVLMDINLPDIDGITLSKQIKQFQKHIELPIIAVTANAMPDDIKKAEGVFEQYLTKPIDFELLSNALKAYI